MAKTRVPAIDGWFTMGDEPALIGGRDPVTGDVFFPKNKLSSPNPASRATEFDDVELSRRGRIWSYTSASYQPPEPYIVPGDEFEPFAIAAVELESEKMIVMGQLAAGVSVDDVRVGDEVELVIEPLYEDDEHEYMVWKWRPVT